MAASSAAHLQNKYADVLSRLRRCRTKPPSLCIWVMLVCGVADCTCTGGGDGRERKRNRGQKQLIFFSFNLEVRH